MPDSKITALTSIGASTDPANDPLVLVDVSDTSMAATGTTKKVTLNQLLGASGTATLASATITGDLTVDTSTLKVDSANNRVGIGTATPATPLNIGTAVSRHFLANGQTTGSSYGEITTTGADVIYGAVDAAAGLFTNAIANASFFGSGNATSLQLVTNSTSRYEISSTGVATWSNVGGVAGTAMTLNSTGLGVGVSPSYRLDVQGNVAGAVYGSISNANTGGSGSARLRIFNSGDVSDGFAIINNYGASGQVNLLNYKASSLALWTNSLERLTIDTSGNVGIGVTPSASHILSCAGPIGISGTNSGTRTSYISNSGACAIYYTDGGGSGFFTDFGNLIIQPRTSAARSVVIATGSTTPVERAVVKSTGQVRFVPLASDPAGAEAGDVYYNSTSNKLKCYNGTTWNDLF